MRPLTEIVERVKAGLVVTPEEFAQYIRHLDKRYERRRQLNLALAVLAGILWAATLAVLFFKGTP